MLRSSFSRPFLVRQFSSTSRIRNQRPLENVSQNQNLLSTTPIDPEVGGSSRVVAKEPGKVEAIDKSSLQQPVPSSTLNERTNFTSSDNNIKKDALPVDLEWMKSRLREWMEQVTIALRHRADDFTATTKSTFSLLGSELNKVTGYEEIEALKRGVVEQEERIKAARQAARDAKLAHEQAVIQKVNSQREVNDLLQRKSTWIESDIARFTSLVKQDHLREQDEARAKLAVDATEEAAEREFSQLMRLILARYHEEQVWSDKIRSASTYGSLAALALNMVVFIMAIVVVEPWKRRRLAQTFEAKIEQLSKENGARLEASMKSIGEQLFQQEKLIEMLKLEALKEMSSFKDVSAEITDTREPQTAPVVETSFRPQLHWDQRQWEVALIGAGAFAVGILSSILYSR